MERPKFRAKDVVAEVRKAGFSKFRVSREHVLLWRAGNAKNMGKGFGVDVAGSWFWYQNWIDHCIEHCKKAGSQYA